MELDIDIMDLQALRGTRLLRKELHRRDRTCQLPLVHVCLIWAQLSNPCKIMHIDCVMHHILGT